MFAKFYESDVDQVTEALIRKISRWGRMVRRGGQRLEQLRQKSKSRVIVLVIL